MISGFSFLSGANFGELVFDLAIDRDLTSTSAQTLSGR